MSKKRFSMGLSFLLMVILFSQCVLSVFAFQTNGDGDALSNDSRSEELDSNIDTDEQKCYTFIEPFDTSSELVSLRDENTKHFLLPDGSFQAVVSGDAVHRKNADGIWENIDNTLIEKNGRLETSDGRVSFSREVQKDDTIFTSRTEQIEAGKYCRIVVSMGDTNLCIWSYLKARCRKSEDFRYIKTSIYDTKNHDLIFFENGKELYVFDNLDLLEYNGKKYDVGTHLFETPDGTWCDVFVDDDKLGVGRYIPAFR